MLNGLPEVIEPWDFPRVKSRYQATVPLDRFPRLATSVQSMVGQVEILLELSIDSTGHAMIEGRLKTNLIIQCQRCLDNYTQTLDKPFRFCVLEQEPDYALDDSIEPLIVNNGEAIITLELIEDELILALPTYAVHPNIQDCDQTMILRATEYKEEIRSNPFAILKNLIEPE